MFPFKFKPFEKACLGINTVKGWLVVAGDTYYFSSSVANATRFQLWNDIARELRRLGLDDIEYQIVKTDPA